MSAISGPLLFALASPASASSGFALTAVAPGIYVHEGPVALASPENRGDIANLGIIVGAEGVAVIDTGGSPAAGRDFLAALRAITDKPVRYVINTHTHPDHILGNPAFKGTGATFVGSARLPAAIAARAESYRDSNVALLGPAVGGEIEFIPPTLLVTDTESLELGGRTIELRAWPVAHTDSDLTVFDPQTGTLFAGDLLFMRHIPALDGSVKGWLAVMDELARIPALRVVPGHGPARAPFPDAMVDQRRYLEALAAGVRQVIAAGGRLAEAPAQVAPEERDRWLLFDEFHARNVTAAFAELEWE